MIPIDTVNVIEYDEHWDTASLKRLKSFPDTVAGNKAARVVFSRWIRVHCKRSKEQIKEHIKAGYYSEDNGCEIVIVHSK